jgi:ornithine cyclodeaminase/alanine dehydrogenase-like protein (mu-crystallin family)
MGDHALDELGKSREIMALFLSEKDVQELLPMPRAIECIEASFAEQHTGGAINRSRQRIFLPGISFHYMAAALAGEQWLGMKVYTVTAGQARFLVLLFDARSGNLLALVEADHLGRIRTGAATGVATKHLAPSGASRVGLVGAGRQACTQIEAVAAVRPVKAARVFSRDETRRREFSEKMSARLGFPVEPVASAEQAVRFGDVIITATSSRDPVVRGDWLRPGTHVNAIGANSATRREIDEATLSRAKLIAVDSLEQARDEAGDLIQGLRSWDGIVELHDIIQGSRPGRTSEEEITIFKSCGIAIWDMAAAGHVYREALQKGKGNNFKIWQT